jgi:hypothetical protein
MNEYELLDIAFKVATSESFWSEGLANFDCPEARELARKILKLIEKEWKDSRVALLALHRATVALIAAAMAEDAELKEVLIGGLKSEGRW